jgi:flagellar biosynthesis protein FlhA
MENAATQSAMSGKAWLQDAAIPAGIVGVVLIMILPLPPLALDLLLATSICLALCILLVAIFLNKPLEFSVFPTVLLVTTMLRLALNVASTRLILLHGAQGTSAAGQLIEAFGRFVVGGSMVVGVIVFLILVIINFLVITKGSGRIAEVAARFTLDSLPGKQMAIDADLAAGLLSEEQARARRTEVGAEADFYGAMDGASKFVRGDAIAGLIITGVNIVGGFIIGVLQEGLSAGEAARTYTLLTVGDGLAAQIPALLISVAAGIIVTRAGGEASLSQNISQQLLSKRMPLTLAAVILAMLAFVPGMPSAVFVLLAALLGVAARRAGKAQLAKKSTPDGRVKAGADAAPAQAEKDVKEQIATLLPLDLLELEVGYELVSLVDPKQGGDLVERIGALRRSFAQELGIIVPSIHIRDNLKLQPSTYRILLSGTTVGEGELRAGSLMAMDSGGVTEKLQGPQIREPAFGLPAIWIGPRDRERAEIAGYTVVDNTTVVATHLTEVIRNHGAELLGRVEVQELLDAFARTSPRLVEELIPSILSLGEVVRVLRGLLAEGIGIRDMRTILEALADHGMATKDPTTLVELVRQRMRRSITERFRSAEGRIDALVLDVSIENMFRETLIQTQHGVEHGALAPAEATRVIHGFERASKELIKCSMPPVLVTAPDIRRAVLAFVQQRVPGLQVISYREIEAGTPVKPLAIVRLG